MNGKRDSGGMVHNRKLRTSLDTGGRTRDEREREFKENGERSKGVGKISVSGTRGGGKEGE